MSYTHYAKLKEIKVIKWIKWILDPETVEEHLNMDCIIDGFVELLFILLGVMILWLYRRMSIFLGEAHGSM